MFSIIYVMRTTVTIRQYRVINNKPLDAYAALC